MSELVSAARPRGLPVDITVAMPIYNAGKHLRLAVLSIIGQSFTDWELLVIDDGSTDNALDSIADLKDERIKIYSDGRNLGLAARLNEACSMATGIYLARMDQDDVSYPDRFLHQIHALQNNPELDLVAARAVTIDEDDQITGMLPFAGTHEEICAHPWRGFFFPHPAWLGRLEWFRKHGYAQPAPHFCEDQELLLRSYKQSRFLALDEVLLAYRTRKQVNWRKLARTRTALLAMQVRFFRQSGKRRSLIRACAVYVVKCAADVAVRLGLSGYPRQPVSDAMAGGWRCVLGTLQAERS